MSMRPACRLLQSFRAIFPQTAVVAISRHEAIRAQATKLGAISAASDASAARIAALIANALKR